MSATVRGAVGAASATVVSSFTIAETAAAPQAGDVRYLFVNTSSSQNISVTPPSGWATVLSTVTVGAGNLAVFSKPWVAGVGTETFTLSASGVFCNELVSVTGVNQAATPTVATNGSSTSGTSLTTATVTPTVSDGLLLAYFSQTMNSAANTATLTVPAGMTDVDHVYATASAAYIARISSLAITSTAAVGPFTSTANQSATWRTAAAVIPSAATTGPTAGNFFRYLGGMNGGFAR